MTFFNLIFIAAAMLYASPAMALSCNNDYGGATGCAGNAQAAGDCRTLGYSTESVDGCPHYLYCPFDTSYKRCIASAEQDCSSYTLSSCPSNAVSCSACGNGTDVKYKADSCKTGWSLQNGNCAVSDCSGFDLASCPDGAVCSSCVAGNSTKYKFSSCSTGYVLNGSECYNCSTMYTRLNAVISNDYYLYCDLGETWCGKDAINCSSTSKNWDNGCICGIIGFKNCLLDSVVGDKDTPVITDPTLPGDETQKTCLKRDETRCLNAKALINNKLELHNKFCPKNKLARTSASFNCTSYWNYKEESSIIGSKDEVTLRAPTVYMCTQWK